MLEDHCSWPGVTNEQTSIEVFNRPKISNAWIWLAKCSLSKSPSLSFLDQICPAVIHAKSLHIYNTQIAVLQFLYSSNEELPHFLGGCNTMHALTQSFDAKSLVFPMAVWMYMYSMETWAA